MTDPAVPDPMARIHAALRRIETAVAARDAASATLERRHNALKSRMVEAVATLDNMLAQAG